jgi:hypothetical protein
MAHAVTDTLALRLLFVLYFGACGTEEDISQRARRRMPLPCKQEHAAMKLIMRGAAKVKLYLLLQ